MEDAVNSRALFRLRHTDKKGLPLIVVVEKRRHQNGGRRHKNRRLPPGYTRLLPAQCRTSCIGKYPVQCPIAGAAATKNARVPVCIHRRRRYRARLKTHSQAATRPYRRFLLSLRCTLRRTNCVPDFRAIPSGRR